LGAGHLVEFDARCCGGPGPLMFVVTLKTFEVLSEVVRREASQLNLLAGFGIVAGGAVVAARPALVTDEAVALPRGMGLLHARAEVFVRGELVNVRRPDVALMASAASDGQEALARFEQRALAAAVGGMAIEAIEIFVGMMGREAGKPGGATRWRLVTVGALAGGDPAGGPVADLAVMLPGDMVPVERFGGMARAGERVDRPFAHGAFVTDFAPHLADTVSVARQGGVSAAVVGVALQTVQVGVRMVFREADKCDGGSRGRIGVAAGALRVVDAPVLIVAGEAVAGQGSVLAAERAGLPKTLPLPHENRHRRGGQEGERNVDHSLHTTTPVYPEILSTNS